MSSHKKLAVNLWSRACGLMERFEDIPDDVPDILASWKIALVKQANYTDLYTNPHAKTIYELLESSTMRSGPTGFWPDGKPHFFIVHDQPDPESRIWEWKLKFEQRNRENYANREKVRARQRDVAIQPEDVDWGNLTSWSRLKTRSLRASHASSQRPSGLPSSNIIVCRNIANTCGSRRRATISSSPNAMDPIHKICGRGSMPLISATASSDRGMC